MSRTTRIGLLALAVLAATTIGILYRSPAQDQPLKKEPLANKDEGKPDAAEAAVRKTAEEYVKAFNKGDAKALAAFWSSEGEYVGPDGEKLRGRAAIEKDYVEFFKDNPRAKVELQVESVRRLGPRTTLEEGTLKVRLSRDKEPTPTRYSALHVREDDGWRLALVREWVPSPAELVSLKDVAWLLGEWVAKSDDTEVRTVYAWDENKMFLRCHYTLKKGGKVINSGTQVIGKDPAGELRSWLFDNSGSIGESSWSRDGDRWVIEATGTLPDGSEVTATNILIPLGKDAFTWQSVERTTAGVSMPDVPPLKVTRVKTDK